jgi:hypothetical protein
MASNGRIGLPLRARGVPAGSFRSGDRMTSPHVHQREGEIPPAAALHRLVDPDHGERL